MMAHIREVPQADFAATTASCLVTTFARKQVLDIVENETYSGKSVELRRC